MYAYLVAILVSELTPDKIIIFKKLEASEPEDQNLHILKYR